MNTQYPVQLIWAGKPYPFDYASIAQFDRLVHLSKKYVNCSVLVGYELTLSKLLKRGADLWLNTPRLTREASGTSGMTAIMNGAVLCSTADGWVPEFAQNGHNAYILPPVDLRLAAHEQDDFDARNLFDCLENEILPTYYNKPAAWWSLVQAGMSDVYPRFDAERMAAEYYERLYHV
jgi:glycogen phosphorylase